ncbi:MAG: hypothetical protein ACQEUB_03595 [Thermodesulfobacteriota bacterium]
MGIEDTLVAYPKIDNFYKTDIFALAYNQAGTSEIRKDLFFTRMKQESRKNIHASLCSALWAKTSFAPTNSTSAGVTAVGADLACPVKSYPVRVFHLVSAHVQEGE